MVALTINWSRIGMYLGMAALFLLLGACCAVLFLVAAVVAYAALCLGMKLAAGVIFALGLMPLAGLLVIAMAFWRDGRQERLQRALGVQP